ncbi:prolyl oligopeptidase family serine peptidase [Streptosporangium sp. NPDC002721]|uniref:S9 family peptidase n=1 Tax=Streptosporangium sp. NPDC002721 TaxID=3366188 RepID=UPI0036ABBA0D
MTEILGARSRPSMGTGLTAWSCRAPALAPDLSAVAFVGDRDGSPRVWIQPLGAELEAWRPEESPQAPQGKPAARRPEEESRAWRPGKAPQALRGESPQASQGEESQAWRPGESPQASRGEEPEAWPVDTGPEPVADVSWSPDARRLAVLVVPGGGEHTQVWTVRPDGGDLRPLAAPEGGSASFVRWTGQGETLLVAEVSSSGRTEAVLIDAASGSREVIAGGALLHPAAVSRDHRRMLLRRGPRGVRRMYVADLPALPGDPAGHPPAPGLSHPDGLATDFSHPGALAPGLSHPGDLAPEPHGGLPANLPADFPVNLPADLPVVVRFDLPPGDTHDIPPGLPADAPAGIRFDLPAGDLSDVPPGLPASLPDEAAGDLPGHAERPLLAGLTGTTDYGILSPDGTTAYLLSDVGRDRAALIAVGEDGAATVLAERSGAELDQFALSADGRLAVLVWNDSGRSELEVVETATGRTRPLPPLPAEVVSSIRVSLDGSLAVLAAEAPGHPSHVLLCDLATGGYRRIAGSGPIPGAAGAELARFQAGDGMELTGWLYRVPGARGPAPFVVYLHGGPESQERPTFNPLFQNLLAAGIGVLAANIRGSSGFGRAFRNADNHALRFDAINDVADCALELARAGIADPARIACMGRSYGGYMTLAALVTHPRLFRAGVDVCGMADFETFYERTEPWIAAAAVSEYGHPVADRDLLRALSPLHSFDRLAAPLLVVHGARDTNVPLYEAEQVLQAARAREVPCELLLFEDEGHEIRQIANRVTFVKNVVEWLRWHLSVPDPA